MHFITLQDSTIGLVSRNDESLSQYVKNYKTLFENLEQCVDGNNGLAVYANRNVLIVPLFIAFWSFFRTAN